MNKIFLFLFLCFLSTQMAFATPEQDTNLNSRFPKIKDDEIVAKYKETNPWGMSVSIDLYSANAEKIRDENYIAQFLKDLVNHIKMKAYGEPIVVNFGDAPEVAGYTAMQLIETSSITAHFAELTNSVYIDIFSCKYYKPYETALWCKEYFEAQEMHVSPVVFRY